MPVRKTTYTIIILMILATVAMADDSFVVTANVSSSVVQAGAPFTYQVTVSGDGSVPNPTVDIPNELRILSGPSSSRSISIVNFKRTTTLTLSWQLVGTRAGTVTFPRPKVESGGKSVTGPKVSVKITSGGNAPAPSQQPSGSRSSSNPTPATSGNSTPSIFIDVDVSNKNPYVQEPVTVTYTLYFKEDVRRFEMNSYPTTDGFWTERLETPGKPETFRKNINGELYTGAVIYQFLAFPTRAGELKIGPMEVSLDVMEQRRRRSRSMFEGFFDFGDPFGDLVKKPVSAPTQTLKVEDLPSANKPVDFNGVVGDFDIAAKLDRDTVMTNESVTLKVTVRGKGNVGFVPEPTLVIPPDIEAYEPKVTEQSQPSAGTMSGTKTFTYLLIPRRAGEQKIDPVRLSYFDPNRKMYVSKKTSTLNLYVEPASGWAAQDVDLPHGAPEEVRSLGTDIRWILDASRGLRRTGTPLYQQAVYPLSYIAPLGLVLLSLWFRKHQVKLAGDVAGRRARKAAKRAMLALKEARDLHSSGNTSEGYDALARGIVHYLADRVHANVGELDRAKVESILIERDVTEGNRLEMLQLLDRCNQARFTPDGLDSAVLGELIDQAKSWIMKVDRRFDMRKK